MERDAVLSDCGRYRYLLRRVWDHKKPRALFIMLNPSTADAAIDDPTIRSCIRLCRALEFGSFEVVNLFAWRATDPDELLSLGIEMIGPRQDKITEAAIIRCDIVICAWGAHQVAATPRGWELIEKIQEHRPLAYCFGKTKNGSPKHPLYIKTGTPLEAY